MRRLGQWDLRCLETSAGYVTPSLRSVVTTNLPWFLSIDPMVSASNLYIKHVLLVPKFIMPRGGATDAYSSLFVSVCVCLLPGYRIVHSKLSPDTSTTGRNIFSELYDKLLVLKLRL